MAIGADRHPRDKSREGRESDGERTVHTRYGALTFRDGRPTPESSQRLHKMLVFNRAIEVYQQHLAAMSMLQFRAMAAAPGRQGAHRVVVWKALLGGDAARLAGGSEMICACAFLDLRKHGPTVLDVRAGTRGVLHNRWMRVVGDIGPPGRDRGEGGRYLVLPPGQAVDIPPGCFTLRSPTFGAWVLLHVTGLPLLEALTRLKGLRICALAQAADGPAVEFLDRADGRIDAVVPTGLRYFEELGALVEQEPAEAISLLERSYLSQIGMRAGRRFEPDEELKALLAEAALVGQAAAGLRGAAHEPPAVPVHRGGDWRRLVIGDLRS